MAIERIARAIELDILGQRLIEIWSSLPFLYTIIIVSSIIVPVYVPGRSTILQSSFWLLVIILSIFEWVSITYYIRGEFYREKARDYVAAAISTGVTEPAMYGINLKYRFPMLCAMIGSAIAGLICGLDGVMANGIGVGGLPGILSIKPQFWLIYSLAILVAIVIPLVLTIMVYKRKAARGELPV